MTSVFYQFANVFHLLEKHILLTDSFPTSYCCERQGMLEFKLLVVFILKSQLLLKFFFYMLCLNRPFINELESWFPYCSQTTRCFSLVRGRFPH